MNIQMLIETAIAKAGSQKKLSELTGIYQQHISEMKNGKRACNLRARAKFAEVAGYSVQKALLEGVIEELDSEDDTQKKAAEGLKAILTAFPDESWRKRFVSNKKRPKTS